MYTYSRRRSSISPAFIAVPIVLILLVSAFQLLRGLPEVEATVALQESMVVGEARPVQLPAAGSSSVAVTGLGVIGSNGPPGPRPIASITKVMTAHLILKAHPLQIGQSGPSLTMTAADANRYLAAIARDESSLPVQAGMVLTQLELLQGMLVYSAGNFAETLAVWDAGSVEAFVQKMNDEARALGMNSTTYADVSGLSSTSMSTPEDQLILARVAMANPVFAQIVAMEQAQITGIGLVESTNAILGQDGVVGIKTGFTEAAGGNLAFAARRQISGGKVEILGVVLGQPDRPAAFAATRQVVTQLAQGLQFARVVSAGQAIATLDPEWAGEVDVVASEDVQMLLWPGSVLQSQVELQPIEPGQAAGTEVGSLLLRLGEQERRIPLVLGEDLPSAGILWKLTRF